MTLGWLEPGRFALLLTLVWGGLALVLLLPGHLAISGIEGDTLHVLDGAMRLAEGARPHLDFSTPLGLIAFGLPALLLAAGLGPGLALLLSNLAVAALLVPGLVHLRATRTGPWAGLVLALWCLGEAAALVYDSTQVTVSFALHYNRWCWAAYTLLLVLLLFPARDGREDRPADGLLLGAGLAFLALTKVTYFAALALPAALWLLGGGRWRALVATLATGLAAAAAVTAWAGGLGIWRAYLADLLLVANSPGRSRPGMSLAEILSAPVAVGGTFVLLAAIILIRLSGQKARGLLLLAAAPGMVYVTYQNWGNAPVWLVGLALLLADARRTCPPERRIGGLAVRPVLGGLAVMAATQILPQVANMVASPFRHLGAARDDLVAPLTPGGWDDLRFLAERSAVIKAEIPLGTPEPPAGALQARFEQLPVTFAGRDFPPCGAKQGLIAQMGLRARSLAALPEVAGGAFLTADVINVTWMFTGGRPLPGGSPWYYGGDKGLAEARFLVVPLCPLSPLARGLMLEAVARSGRPVALRHADAVLAVYEMMSP